MKYSYVENIVAAADGKYAGLVTPLLVYSWKEAW